MGTFLARIPNDENAQAIIDELRNRWGALRVYGRHKDRVGVLKKNGLNPNTHHDLPWRLGTEIVIYRKYKGMPPKQFFKIKKGELVKFRNNISNGYTLWTPRTLFVTEPSGYNGIYIVGYTTDNPTKKVYVPRQVVLWNGEENDLGTLPFKKV